MVVVVAVIVVCVELFVCILLDFPLRFALLPSGVLGTDVVCLFVCLSFGVFASWFFLPSSVLHSLLEKACFLLHVVLLPESQAVELVQGHPEHLHEVLRGQVSLGGGHRDDRNKKRRHV